jgi:hypothetical protein
MNVGKKFSYMTIITKHNQQHQQRQEEENNDYDNYNYNNNNTALLHN